MPEPKDDFEEIYPCDFYTPAELLDPETMYTVPEIARMLQGLEPDADVDEGTEAVLVDWAIPWVMTNADDLVIGEPLREGGPGYYGLAPDASEPGESTENTENAKEKGDSNGAEGSTNDGA